MDHCFGVPGDYVLRFYERLCDSPISHIGTTREDTAAFAAVGYARIRGLGALAVTYGVGALNVVNAAAGANAELSPVVVVSGAPGVAEQRDDPQIHHRFGPFRLSPAVIVLDNRGYTTYRFILDGPFNDIAPWRFHRLGELFGPMRGFVAPTEEAFEEALGGALAFRDGPSLVEVQLRPEDCSSALARLSERLRAVVASA